MIRLSMFRSFHYIVLCLLLGLIPLYEAISQNVGILDQTEPPLAPEQFVFDPKNELPEGLKANLTELLKSHHSATQQKFLYLLRRLIRAKKNQT
jgi:hypothetical protein